MATVKLAATLQKGLQILEAFSIEEPNLTLQQVVQKTAFPTATAYRLLRTLVLSGHIRYNQKTGTYRLGPKIMSLGFRVLSNLGLRETAFPHLEALSNKTDQNVNMGILEGIHVVYIERIIKRRILNLDIFVGSRVSTFLTSCGRAILAFMEKSQFEETLSELLKCPEGSDRLGSDGAWLIDRLAKEREQGFALNDEELIVGMRAAATPVFNAHGKVEAAINIAAMSHGSRTEDFVGSYIPPLLETAQNISNELKLTGQSLYTHYA